MRKFYSLSAHKPRQIRFCSEIPWVGACVKSVQSTLNLTNGGTNFISLQAPSEQVLPRNLLSRGLCKISPSCITSSKRMNKFYSTIGPQTPSEPVLTRNPLSGGLCKISSAYAKSYKRRNKFYFTTSPVWNSFAQKSPYQGLCKISPICITSYKWMNKFYFTTLPQAPSEHVLPRNLLSGGLVQNQSSMHYTLQTDEQIFLHDWPTVQETSKLSFCHIFAPSCGPTRCSWRLWSHRVMCNGLIWSEFATLPKSKNAKLGPSRTSGIHWRALEHQGQ